MITFVATLRSGGDYKPYDAITLARQVAKHMKVPHRFVCMTDMDFEDEFVQTEKLIHNWPGWWSMVEMFRLTGPVIASGLDMVVVGNMDRLSELAMTCPSDVFYMVRPSVRVPYNKKDVKYWKSAIQIWNGDWSWLYKGFNYKKMAPRFKGEEKYTATMLLKRDNIRMRAVQEYFDGCYSYKMNCQKGKPDDATLIFFHGKPRPADCNAPWIKEVYWKKWDYTHPFKRMKDEVA